MTLTPLIEATTEVLRAIPGREYRLILSASGGKIMLENNVVSVKKSGKVTDTPRPGVGEPLKLQKATDDSLLSISERVLIAVLESLGDAPFSIMGSTAQEIDVALPENRFICYREDGLIAHDGREGSDLRECVQAFAPEVTFGTVDQFREALQRALAGKLSKEADPHGKIKI